MPHCGVEHARHQAQQQQGVSQHIGVILEEDDSWDEERPSEHVEGVVCRDANRVRAHALEELDEQLVLLDIGPEHSSLFLLQCDPVE